MSLPVALGLDGTDELSAQQKSSDNHHSSLPTEGCIGLVWAAGHKPNADARSRSEQRSLPPEILVSVLNQQLGNRWQTGAIKLVNLQQDRYIPEQSLLRKHLAQAAPSGSWLDTHQKLTRLDGLVCVDTAIAHLAGLVGLPTLLVLNTPCDWRWGTSGSRSPWYPNLQLVRRQWQPVSGSA